MILAAFSAIACATTYMPDVDESQPEGYEATNTPVRVKRIPPLNIDEVTAIVQVRDEDLRLGFQKFPFDPCKVGLRDTYCGRHYLAVVNVKVYCRDTNGSSSDINSAYEPFDNWSVTFKYMGKRGRVTSDRDGMVRVKVVHKYPDANERLIILKGKHSMGVRAKDAKKVVVPSDWCQV